LWCGPGRPRGGAGHFYVFVSLSFVCAIAATTDLVAAALLNTSCKPLWYVILETGAWLLSRALLVSMSGAIPPPSTVLLPPKWRRAESPGRGRISRAWWAASVVAAVTL